MLSKSKKREALKNTVRTRAVSISVSRQDDTDSNTLSFVFVSNDNAGVRYDWGSGEYYNEILDVTGAKVHRLNTFFKDHLRSVDSAVGKISNVRVEDMQLIGDVTFGSDEDSQRIFRKYSEGILTDVSIGYEIRKYNVKPSANNERDNVTVTEFDIFEVSAVGIGFDSGAKKRSDDENLLTGDSDMNEELLQRIDALEKLVKRTSDEDKELKELSIRKDAEVLAENERLKAENADMKRRSDIIATAMKYGTNVELRDKFIADTTKSVVDFQVAILESRAAETVGHTSKVDEVDSRKKMIDAMVDGLALRVGANISTPHADADKYRYASLVSIGNALLPEKNKSLNPVEVAERSLLTGDFPLLLQAVGARVLTSEFEAQTATFKMWMNQVDVPDFRVMSELTTSVGGGRLDKTLENGDLKELSGTEKAESWKIRSFGNKFVLTREMIINDDLGNFTNLLATFGRMAINTANGISYDILQLKGDYATYKMADGLSVYAAGRNNSATDALSPAALSAGRLAMSKHKASDGKTPLNIRPKYLIVSPALEETAREILGATNKISSTANTGEINVHQNSLILIVDAEIESDTAWYLVAERRTLKMGYLAGTNRSPVVKLNDSSLIRTTFEGVFDVGVMVEDYRGLYRGNV